MKIAKVATAISSIESILSTTHFVLLTIPQQNMNLIPRLSLVATTAAVAFPLAHWLTETFHVDCVRASASRFQCVVESSKRGNTRLFALDETSLSSARTDRETRVDPQDHMVSYSYHLTLVQPKGAIRSHGGDQGEINKRVAEINAFLTNPSQPSVRFTHNNRTMMLTMAALMVVAAALLTHDFSHKPKSTT